MSYVLQENFLKKDKNIQKMKMKRKERTPLVVIIQMNGLIQNDMEDTPRENNRLKGMELKKENKLFG